MTQDQLVLARGGFLPGGLGVALAVVAVSLAALIVFIIVARKNR